jgi:hypothetical protein
MARPGWVRHFLRSEDVRVSDLPSGFLLAVELAVIVVMVLTFAIGTGALWGNPTKLTACATRTAGPIDVTAFSTSIGFRGWVAALTVTVGLAVAVFVTTLATVVHVYASAERITRVTAALFYLVVAVTVYLVPRRLNTVSCVPLPGYQPRLLVVFLVILLCCAPAFLSLVMIPARLRHTDPAAGDAVRSMMRTGLRLRRLLACLAVVIAAATVSTSLLRQALIGVAPSRYQLEFPSQNVLFYGLFFTILLALVYFPAYLVWQEQARELVDALVPIPPAGAPTSDLIGARKDLESLLGLTASAAGTFTTAFGLLAPLVVSALVAGITGAR